MQRFTTLLAIIVLVLQQVFKTLLRIWFSGRAGKISIGVGVFLLLGMCGALGDGADAERTAVQPAATVQQVAVEPTATRSPSPQAATPTATTEPTATSEPTATAAPTETPTAAPTNTPEPTATTVVLPTATTAAPAAPAAGSGGRVQPTGSDCPAGFPIKGNGDSGIYHTTDSPNYESTDPEACFATAADAEAAGYRARKR